MSMPTIPAEPHRPNRNEVIIDLLESIALEEIALSHIMNAEAEKIQAFVGKCHDFPTNPTSCEIIKFNKGVTQLLETIVMKEWLLLRKLENVLEFHDKDSCSHHDHCKEHHHEHHKCCKVDCCCPNCKKSSHDCC
ncbi:hypothetical protein ACFSO7_04430 [Bacillus sp. CGMCC 1.16607]|uniref:hypothetical protein n=1 Tax=Bacillus sp. CGMCC 1.16607 TaxID=3351842 RepID=UPI00363FE725